MDQLNKLMEPLVQEAEKMEELRQALELKEEQLILTPNPQSALLVAQLQERLEEEILKILQLCRSAR